MMTPTMKLQFVRRQEGKDVVRILQQQWIDDDPPDEGAPRHVWRDIPSVDEPAGDQEGKATCNHWPPGQPRCGVCGMDTSIAEFGG